MISWFKNILNKSDFNRNIVKLISGTATANLINFLSLPILARIYSVEDFGNFQLLFSLITILGVISCLKYEMTIPLPQNKNESDILFIVSLMVLTGFTIILTLVLFLFEEKLFFYSESLSNSIKLISPAAFSLGLYELMNYLYMRNKEFGKIAKYRISQVILIQCSAIFLGLYSPGFEKMIISFIFGNIVISIIMIIQSNFSISNFNFLSLSTIAISYKKFPIINMPMALINTVSMQLPVFMLSAYSSSEVVGYYMMANRILTAPIHLISRSVGQVYYKEAVDCLRLGKKKVVRIFGNTVKQIAKIGFIPYAIAIVFSPVLTKLFLGDVWTTSGIFMQIMVPWIFFQFVNMTVTTTFSIVNKQEIGFLLNIISVLLRYFAMYYWNENAITQITALSIVASLFYITFMISSYLVLKK